MNVFSFTGNLGRDCETRTTSGGDVITSFSVGAKSGYGKNEQTLWIKCAIFGKRGESLSKYLVKGTQVAVSGELSLNVWTDKEGKERTDLQVRVNDVTLLGKKADKPESKPAPKSKADDDDSIPF